MHIACLLYIFSMLPTRFSSVRQKNRLHTGLPSFRDDTSLVGFRYEKTKPAEPPVPLPPSRNPLRTPSLLSVARSNTTATNKTQSTSSSSVSSFSVSPVVVAPPTALAYMPSVAPPTEQHPALRSPLPANALGIQDGKRDSGHAATANSDSVIHEEDCEDDYEQQQYLSEKMNELAREGAIPEAMEHIEYRDEDRALAVVDRAAASVAALHGPPPASPTANSPSSPQSDIQSRVFKQPVSPRKLVKKTSTRFSVFRGRSSSEASGRAEEASPMESEPKPLMRGSIATPASSMHKPGQDDHFSQQTALPPSGGLNAASNDTCSSSASAIPDLDAQFAPLAISIPTDSLLDDAFMTGFSFSKRGSLMFGGKRATMATDGATDFSPSTTAALDHGNTSDTEMPDASLDQTVPEGVVNGRPSSTVSATDTVNRTTAAQPLPDIRILSPDIEKESQKVRSLYSTSDAINWEDGARFSFCEHLEPTPEVPAEEDPHDPYAVLWLPNT